MSIDELFFDSSDSVFFGEGHFKLKERARRFAKERVAPVADFIEQGNFPRELLSEMGEQGFMGVMIPEEYGGSGLGVTGACIVTEELSKYSTAMALCYGPCMFAQVPVMFYGGERLKQKYLPRMAKGAIGAITISEEGGGSDTASMEARVRRRGDYYILDAEKWFITNAGEADLYVVYARSEPLERHGDMSVFVVEKGVGGFEFVEENDVFGCRGISNGVVRWTGSRVPVENLVGVEREGFDYLMKMFSAEKLIISSQSLGLSERCFREAYDWSGEREQFGRKIGRFQAVDFKLDDLAARVASARNDVYAVASMYDGGLEVRGRDAGAKVITSKLASRAADVYFMVHGGRGYCRNRSKAPQFIGDSRLPWVGGGTIDVMYLVISGALRKLRREAGEREGVKGKG